MSTSIEQPIFRSRRSIACLLLVWRAFSEVGQTPRENVVRVAGSLRIQGSGGMGAVMGPEMVREPKAMTGYTPKRGSM